jgi:hypothetical protein
MIARFILIGAVAALASASPLTVTFTGVADGALGTTSFTQADFTITFTSDTTDIIRLPTDTLQPLTDWSTPSGTPATFSIMIPMGATLGGTLTDTQAVFAHPSPEMDLGIWHYNANDFIAKQDPAFATYDLTSSIGPISTGTNAWPDILTNCGGNDCGFSTSAGHLTLSNITAMTATADVTASGPTPTPPGAVPEPSTGLLFALGIGGIAAGRGFRKRA